MTTRSLKTVTITEERQAGAIGAGFFIYRNNDVQRIADIQTNGFAPRY
jgi:hypothetical protein